MADLTLRPTRIGGDLIANDFCVHFEGRPVGRIRLAENHVNRTTEWRWYINPPLPVPAWADGAAASLDQAKTEFRTAWDRFYARLTPERIVRWHQVDDAARAK